MGENRVELLSPALADQLREKGLACLPRVSSAITRLFTASMDTGYDYSHHASLGLYDGRLHAFWSNGRGGEDRPGQVQRWSVCDAAGSWSMPRLLAAASMNPTRYPATTTVINGGTAASGSGLWSFYSEYKGRPADGAGGTGKWSLPVVTGAQVYEPTSGRWLHCGVSLEDFLLNEGPRRTLAGRWIMTGEDHAGRTRVAVSDARDPADPAWRVVSVPKGEGAHFKNEPTWFERPDGMLVLLLRDDGGSHCLWLATSEDGGLTWSVPRPTNWPDATAKCHAGRLPDGSYFCLSNPDPAGRRIPLTIALSEDGVTFGWMGVLRDEQTAPRLPGRFKGPGYQYPHAIVNGDELAVIYSVNKEDVEVLTVPLGGLRNLAHLA